MPTFDPNDIMGLLRGRTLNITLVTHYLVHFLSPPRFDHFAKLHDVQTLAMLACVFQMHCTQYLQEHPQTNNNTAPRTNPSPPKKFPGQLSDRESRFSSSQEGDAEAQERREREESEEEKLSHWMNCRWVWPRVSSIVKLQI